MKTTLLALVLASSLVGTLFGGGDDIQVVELTRDDVIYVSFAYPNGFTEDMRAALRSGLETAITYQIELRRQMPVWFDKTLVSVTLTSSAKYDNLTRLHRLSRTIDGRGEEQPKVTSNEEDVRQFLTSVGSPPEERLALFKTTGLERNAEYLIVVRARSKPRTGWFLFWPFDRGTATGYARFTFIPS